MANSRLHASSSPLSSPTRVHTQVQAHDPNLSGDDEIDSDSPSLIHASPSPSHPNSFEKPLKFPRLVPPISKPNTAGSARTLNNKLPLSASSSDLIDHNKAIGDENDLEFVATDQGEDETVPKEGIQAKVSLSTHNPTIGDVLNHTTPTNLDSRSALQPASSHPGFTGLTTETPPAIPSTMPTTERRTSASPFTPKSTSKSGSNVASTSNPKAASPTHPKGKLHSRRSSKNTTIGVIVDSEPAKGRSRKTATTEVADLVSKGATTNRHTRQSSRKKSTTPAPTPITSTSKHPQGHLRRSSRGTAALVAEFQQEEKPEVLEAIEEQANLEKPRPIKKQGRKGRSKSDLQITSHDGREGHPDGMRQTQAATVGKDHSTPKPPDTIEELDIHSAGEEETGTVGVGRNRELPIAPDTTPGYTRKTQTKANRMYGKKAKTSFSTRSTLGLGQPVALSITNPNTNIDSHPSTPKLTSTSGSPSIVHSAPPPRSTSSTPASPKAQIRPPAHGTFRSSQSHDNDYNTNTLHPTSADGDTYPVEMDTSLSSNRGVIPLKSGDERPPPTPLLAFSHPDISQRNLASLSQSNPASTPLTTSILSVDLISTSISSTSLLQVGIESHPSSRIPSRSHSRSHLHSHSVSASSSRHSRDSVNPPSTPMEPPAICAGDNMELAMDHPTASEQSTLFPSSIHPTLTSASPTATTQSLLSGENSTTPRRSRRQQPSTGPPALGSIPEYSEATDLRARTRGDYNVDEDADAEGEDETYKIKPLSSSRVPPEKKAGEESDDDIDLFSPKNSPGYSEPLSASSRPPAGGRSSSSSRSRGMSAEKRPTPVSSPSKFQLPRTPPPRRKRERAGSESPSKRRRVQGGVETVVQGRKIVSKEGEVWRYGDNGPVGNNSIMTPPQEFRATEEHEDMQPQVLQSEVTQNPEHLVVNGASPRPAMPTTALKEGQQHEPRVDKEPLQPPPPVVESKNQHSMVQQESTSAVPEFIMENPAVANFKAKKEKSKPRASKTGGKARNARASSTSARVGDAMTDDGDETYSVKPTNKRRPRKSREVTLDDLPQHMKNEPLASSIIPTSYLSAPQHCLSDQDPSPGGLPADGVGPQTIVRVGLDTNGSIDAKFDEESGGKDDLPKEPNFEEVIFGPWRIVPWYFSPYPPMRLDQERIRKEKKKYDETYGEHHAANFGPKGKFAKGNQMSGQKRRKEALAAALKVANASVPGASTPIQPQVEPSHHVSNPSNENIDQQSLIVVDGTNEGEVADSRGGSAKPPSVASRSVERSTPLISQAALPPVPGTAKADQWARGYCLWVCEWCMKASDRPLDPFQRSDGTWTEGHACLSEIPGYCLYDDGKHDPEMPQDSSNTASTSTSNACTLLAQHNTSTHPPMTTFDNPNMSSTPSLHQYEDPTYTHPTAMDSRMLRVAPTQGPADMESQKSRVHVYPDPVQLHSNPTNGASYAQDGHACDRFPTQWPPAPATAYPLSPAKFHDESLPEQRSDSSPITATHPQYPQHQYEQHVPQQTQFGPQVFYPPHGRHSSRERLQIHEHQPMHGSSHPYQQGHGYQGYYQAYHEQARPKAIPKRKKEARPRKKEREGRRRIYEVDGKDPRAQYRLFCQNLALFGKLFLDGKYVFFECENFFYYIVTTVYEGKERVVGFFSKEKDSEENNLACIIVFPPYQKQGFGRLLIQFTLTRRSGYEISKSLGVIGSPEKPLSDLGLKSYYPIWANMILDYLLKEIKVDTVVIDRPRGGRNSQKQHKRLGTSKTLTPYENHEDGSASVHLSFECTLQQIADGAGLTVADASFALGELGLVWHFLEGGKSALHSTQELSVDARTNMPTVTRDLVNRISKKWRFRKEETLNTDYLFFSSSLPH